MIVSVGEILFDKFPDYQRIGGAPFNFAYHTKSLGFDVRFISRIGDDEDGKAIMAFLHEKGFPTDTIQVDKIYRTGEVLIRLDSDGNAQFDILPDVAYDHIQRDRSIERVLGQAELLYFGSLVQRSEHGFGSLQDIVGARGKTTKCLYDVNLRPNCYNERIVKTSLEKADVVKLNSEEVSIIQQFFHAERDDDRLIEALLQDYDLDMVSVTRGNEGSSLYTKGKCYHIRPHKDVKVVDTVGAGDGYAAVLAIGYLRNWHPEKILYAATEFAGRICRIKGAFPSDSDFYDDFQQEIRGLTR